MIKMIVLSLLIVWGCRYLYINHGNLCAYPRCPIEDYRLNDIVEFGDNYSGFQDSLTGYSISLISYNVLTFDEFCKKYDKAPDDFMYQSDVYLEVNVNMENHGELDTPVQIGGLFICGEDWYRSSDPYATAYANQISIEQLSGIALDPNTSSTLKIIYCLQKGNFPISRWNHFENERIWLIATLAPVEKRILLQ